MKSLWAEIDVTVTVAEKCAIVIEIINPTEEDLDTLIRQAESEAIKRIPEVISNPETTKVSNVSYQRRVKRFYPDIDGNPDLYSPLEIETLGEIINADNPVN